ncbi:uncharacterized protein [Dermacentor andersoni]|uniref:uncharacterized protein n=1 Tax=Dermacentor andersoni TaxID=34620 RepID=UPI0024169403|nr:uncharacterized protein LOC126521666 [Dermacentor andersoni]
MWTDDTGDEIVSISTENLQEQRWRTVRVAGGQSLGQRFLGSKFSILLLAAIAVLFAGLLPFVAFRAAILSSSRALAAASAVTSRLARTASSSVNRQAQDAVTAFDVVMAQRHDHGLAPADHHSIERNAVRDSGDPHGGRAHQPLRTQRHHAVVAHDELLPQVMEHPKPCDSPACQREALNISEQLDESVSPCDDFYTHVCGRWTQRVAVPNGSARVSVDTLTQDHLTHLVDGAFRRYSEELERVADLYNECRSHKSGDFERALFDELVGGFGNVSWYLSIRTMAGRLRKSVWPTFRDVGDTKLSASIGAFYRTVNEPALFSIKPTTDSDFPNETLISVGLPTLVMGSFIQHSPKMRDDSNDYNYVSDAMDMILRQSNLTHGIKVNVLNVELTLARAIGTAVPEAPRLVQVQELPSTGKLKWDALLRSMMAETDTNFSSVYVSVDSMRYLYALQEALHELQDVEILAYLGFRTKLVLAPLLMDNDSLSLLGALAVSPFPEWHPPLSREHYCVRFFEKFEPALSLYAARDDIGRRLRRLRAASLVDALRKAVHEEMAALFPKPFLNHVTRILRSAKWTALMPDWAHTALLRAKYVDYFYSKVGRAPVHQQFSLLIKLKNANQYQRYLTGIFFDAPWTGGLLRTSATVGEDRVDVPPGAFDFFRADEPSLVPLQMARLGPRVATSVYRFVFAKVDFLGDGRRPEHALRRLSGAQPHAAARQTTRPTPSQRRPRLPRCPAVSDARVPSHLVAPAATRRRRSVGRTFSASCVLASAHRDDDPGHLDVRRTPPFHASRQPHAQVAGRSEEAERAPRRADAQAPPPAAGRHREPDQGDRANDGRHPRRHRSRKPGQLQHGLRSGYEDDRAQRSASRCGRPAGLRQVGGTA